MSTHVDTRAPVKGSLRDASLDRLACLLRHWTWADEPMASFDRELANGWDYDDDPMSDRPFGAHYYWCALMCAFGEAAVDHGLLSPLQLEPIRQDIEASLPGLRACRQLLVVIPASLKEHPRIVDLLRDGETLARPGAFIRRSVKRSGRNKSSGRSTHWIRKDDFCSSGVLQAERGAVVLPLLATRSCGSTWFTDGPRAPAFGVEPAGEDVMHQPPRPAGEGVLTPRMWRQHAFVGVIMAAGMLFVLDLSLPGGSSMAREVCATRRRWPSRR